MESYVDELVMNVGFIQEYAEKDTEMVTHHDLESRHNIIKQAIKDSTLFQNPIKKYFDFCRDWETDRTRDKEIGN